MNAKYREREKWNQKICAAIYLFNFELYSEHETWYGKAHNFVFHISLMTKSLSCSPTSKPKLKRETETLTIVSIVCLMWKPVGHSFNKKRRKTNKNEEWEIKKNNKRKLKKFNPIHINRKSEHFLNIVLKKETFFI